MSITGSNNPNTWGEFRLWFAANRTRIGLFLFSLASFVKVVAKFEGSSELADTISLAAEIVMAGGFGLATAGAAKGDDYYKELKLRKEAGFVERRGSRQAETLAELEQRVVELKKFRK